MATSAKFYAEKFGVDIEIGERMALFVAIANKHNLSPLCWQKHGMLRVYFTFKSQNRLPVFDLPCKTYFDAQSNDVVFAFEAYQQSWKENLSYVVERHGRSFYSGSKTRERVYKFSEEFYAKKDDGNQHV